MELLVGKMVRLEKLRFPEVKEPGQSKDYQVLSGRAQLVGHFFQCQEGSGRVLKKKSRMAGGFGSGRRVEFLIRYSWVPYLLSVFPVMLDISWYLGYT